MAYNYNDQRSFVFTEKGQKTFLKIRDNAFKLITKAGCAKMGNLTRGTGEIWNRLACVDRLVELGELREINYGECSGQDRIFVRVE